MPEAAIKQPIAKICGEPLMEIPHDLYIPPDAMEVLLDTFQGPLDLLLYLIRKHNLEIRDIPMAELTRQYMAYVKVMRVEQLELAAEYLLMTALLIEIKSRMLLPNPVDTAEEENDPRAELVRRLLEYEQIKLAALRLDELPRAERDFALVQVWIEKTTEQAPPNVCLEDLKQAWIALIARANVNRHHHVSQESLSVRAYMSQILRYLKDREMAEFNDFFKPEASVAEVIVTFIALLELAKERLLEITQTKAFGVIYVRPVVT